MKQPFAWAAAGTLLLLADAPSRAQVQSIPSEGLPGLTKAQLEFEPEYRQRMKKGLGQYSPAPEGTPPGSSDPQNIEGIWIAGTATTVGQQAGGGPGGGGGPPGGPGGPGGPGAGGPGTGGPPGGAPAAQGAAGKTRSKAQGLCRPGSPFALGTPSKIIQSDTAIYILKAASMSQNGNSYRRIAMQARHPASVVPSAGGDSIGHWEGDTLIVETTGLTGAMSAGGGPGGPPGGGAARQFTPQSVVTERIRKIEKGLKLEDLVTIQDPALAQPTQLQLVSYYRPDLKFIEAPCEEYADPLETESSGPFAGGDETQQGGPPPGSTTPAPGR